ncbi:MAG: response regulator transcription factor [Polaromonas sp.]|uniref:response regulator n=1 Tax=Polaromonas sp. TaxID=1869339 RepID=UPI0027341EB6|nr:response regulator transcription factor [Polaromonas sp.]MDP2820423.1 response regulator transcription factor [Polaromonas sp.]
MMIDILLIDDHALFRSGLAMVLKDGIAGADIAQVASLEEAMRDALPAPHVVLLDVQLQGLNGLEGIALVRRRWPDALVVMLSSQAEPRTVRQALARGAAAFVSKADTAETIVSVITTLMRGETVVTRIDGFADSQPAGLHDGARPQRLTPRQAEVLDLLCQGLSNKVIGRRLNLSENTVRGHVQATLSVLGVSSRSEAAFAARRIGLVF